MKLILLSSLLISMSLGASVSEKTVLQSYTLDTLDDVANFLVSISDGREKACGINKELSAQMLGQIKALIDLKYKEIKTIPKSWSICKCNCASYSRYFDSLDLNALSERDKQIYKAIEYRSRTDESKKIYCISRGRRYCQSPLFDYLRSTL